MKEEVKRNSRLEKLLATKTKTLELGTEVVDLSFFENQSLKYPLIITPNIPGVVLRNWIEKNQNTIYDKLKDYGAILFRGFNIESIDKFQTVSESFGDRLSYTNRSSPRTEIENRIYTSTEHPADQVINMHCELSYVDVWPMKLLFYCFVPAAEGGQTPIANTKNVLAKLKNTTVKQFKEKGVLYRRNFGPHIGLRWQEVFQTENSEEVEKECKRKSMKLQWIDGNTKLRIEWVRPAIVEHPTTKEDVWFNHAFFFHASTLGDEATSVLEDDDIPFFTFFGDGTVIPEETIDEIRLAFEESKVVFDWKQGDILLLDNMLMAHGRNSYKGERRTLVAMVEPSTISI